MQRDTARSVIREKSFECGYVMVVGFTRQRKLFTRPRGSIRQGTDSTVCEFHPLLPTLWIQSSSIPNQTHEINHKFFYTHITFKIANILALHKDYNNGVFTIIVDSIPHFSYTPSITELFAIDSNMVLKCFQTFDYHCT